MNLENRGSIPAEFAVVKPDTIFGSKFKFQPEKGVIQGAQAQLIKIQFFSDTIGEFSEVFKWKIAGSFQNLTLSFSGTVVGPSFHFDVDHIDFGVVSYAFWNTKYIKLVNTSDIPMNFKLRVPEDGTLLQREFDIVPSAGVVKPHSEIPIKIDFNSNTVKKYNANLVVDVEGVGTDVCSIPITAQCVVPEVMLSAENINFGDCFIGYTYSQTLELGNNSSLPAKYEVILPEEENAHVDCTVDSKFGTVPERSTHKVKVTIVTKKIGNVYIPLYIRIVGSESPPFAVSVSACSIGPIVELETNKIEFGKVSVLKDHSKSLPIVNKSPIQAHFRAKFKKGVLFRTPVTSGVIMPNSIYQLQIIVNSDESMKISDEITIDIQYAEPLTAKISATGIGTSIVSSIPMDVIDFGNQFSSRQCTVKFTFTNMGRKTQTIQWIPLRERKKGDKKEEYIQVFKITPERTVIQPRASLSFKCEGYSTKAAPIEEKFICRTVGKVQKTIYTTSVKCTFTLPLIKFSQSKLAFEYTFNPNRPPTVQVNKL